MYKDMSTDSLLEEHQKLSQEIEVLREKRKAIKAELSTRSLETKVLKMTENMDDAQKVRLAQTLFPKGIGTKEELGQPGAKQ